MPARTFLPPTPSPGHAAGRALTAWRAPAAVLVLSLVADPGGAAAGDIYKHRDVDGRVTYSDRPPAVDAEKLQMTPTPSATPELRALHERTARSLEAYAAERAEKRAVREKERADAAERARHCAAARKESWEREHASRLYYHDDSGQEINIEGTDYEAALKEARDAVDKYCD